VTQSLQVSSKLPDGRIFVVGGDDIDSFEQNLKSIVGPEKAQDLLTEMATSLTGAGGTATAIANLNAGGLTTTVDHTAHPNAGAQMAPSSRTCGHGTMTPRTGSGAKGPWKGYFCPSPKGTPDQCSPVFIQRNDPAWNTF
jgi:hypothetical protein